MSMSMRTLFSSSAKLIGTWITGRPDLSRARISALALNALTSPNNLVIAAFQPGGPAAGIWAWPMPAAPEARIAARAGQTVFVQFISEFYNSRRAYRDASMPPSGIVRSVFGCNGWNPWERSGSECKNVLQLQLCDVALFLKRLEIELGFVADDRNKPSPTLEVGFLELQHVC